MQDHAFFRLDALGFIVWMQVFPHAMWVQSPLPMLSITLKDYVFFIQETLLKNTPIFLGRPTSSCISVCIAFKKKCAGSWHTFNVPKTLKYFFSFLGQLQLGLIWLLYYNQCHQLHQNYLCCNFLKIVNSYNFTGLWMQLCYQKLEILTT